MSQPTGFARTLTLLQRTPNPSASEVLDLALQGPSATIRKAAIRALALRNDEASQRRFLEQLPQFRQTEIAHLPPLARPFRKTIRRILQEYDVTLCGAACQLLLTSQAVDDLPALIEAATAAENPCAQELCTTTLLLARHVRNTATASDDTEDAIHDSYFARRGALAALETAIERYAEHRRDELVEAFLLLAPPDHELIERIMRHQGHACHQVFLQTFRSTPSPGVIQRMAELFEDPNAPIQILEIALQRSDLHFLTLFLGQLGTSLSSTVLNNLKRVKEPGWLGKPSSEWAGLPGQQQETIIQLTKTAPLSERAKLDLFDGFLKWGAPEARLAACIELTQLAFPDAVGEKEVTQRIEELLDDPDPLLVANAAFALRQRGFADVVPQLAELLDHHDSAVRQAARSALRDFTFDQYLDEFEEMEGQQQRELGPIVARVDPQAKMLLQRELSAPTLSRKVRGLRMARTMGLVSALLDDIINLSKHNDAEIRYEAVETLALSSDSRAHKAVQARQKDSNRTVRKRAETIRGAWEWSPPRTRKGTSS